MKLIRSRPSRPRPDRAYVVDSAQAVTVDHYDYRGLADVGDDVIQLDWDIAVAKQDLREFAARARCTPDRVLVAPYPIYPDTRPGLPGITWPFRRYVGPDRLRYVREGEPFCHLFGFGMVYLPRNLIAGFCADHPDANFDDNAFAGWHYRNVREEVPIEWDIRPVHLNYDIGRLGL